ncbi:MAG: hypothetical protein ABSB33_05720, partial [Tepidisphaeraceae bacterium]
PGDIGAREIAILVPLALAVVWLGVYPSGVLRSMNDAVTRIQQPILNATDSSKWANAILGHRGNPRCFAPPPTMRELSLNHGSSFSDVAQHGGLVALKP